MIQEKEISVRYFESSRSLAFDQQADVTEIDRLLAAYRKWENGKVDKI